MWINGKYKEKLACVLNATSDDAGKVLAVGSDGNFELVPNTESVATPTATPNGGEVNVGSTVALSCATTGATIHYTTDGSTPTSSSSTYSSAITISANTTIKAIAVKNGLANSSVMSKSFTVPVVVTPVANPTGSAVASGSTVELSCETTGASIYYTTNGDTPTSSSTLYESAIEITTGVTIKAIGIKTGSANSSVMSETYTIAE